MEMRLIIMAIVCLCIAQLAFASDDQQSRFIKLSKEIRCSICQNQSLFESNSVFAQNIRAKIRTMIELQYNDKQIKQSLSNEYGDTILFNPPFNLKTLALWLGPIFMLALGSLFFLRNIKQ